MSDYETFARIVNEIPTLIEANITASDPYFQAWKIKAKRFLLTKYGEDSLEYSSFLETDFSLCVFTGNTPHSEFVGACQNGLETTRVVFKTYLDEMAEEEENQTKVAATPLLDYKSVFIVHGHDGELKQSVARILEKQDIDPIILSEQTNQGRTIIEKIEANSNVCCAICLLTADDFGRSKSVESDAPRARQNVVLETGYFWGKLGRERIIILVDNGVELPSDLSGVVYTNTTDWQFALLSELADKGYEIDFKKMVKL